MQRTRRITMLIVIKLNLIILNTSKKQKQLAKDNSFTLPADTFLQALLLSFIRDIHSASTQNCHFLYDRRRPHGRPHFCCNIFSCAGLLQHNFCFQPPFFPFCPPRLAGRDFQLFQPIQTIRPFSTTK